MEGGAHEPEYLSRLDWMTYEEKATLLVDYTHLLAYDAELAQALEGRVPRPTHPPTQSPSHSAHLPAFIPPTHPPQQQKQPITTAWRSSSEWPCVRLSSLSAPTAWSTSRSSRRNAPNSVSPPPPTHPPTHPPKGPLYSTSFQTFPSHPPTHLPSHTGVGFYNFPQVVNIRQMRSDRIGHLSAVAGTVTRTSDVRPELYVVRW